MKKLIKGKTYAIGDLGVFEYDGYVGKGKYLGDKDGENYLFEIDPTEKFPFQKTAYFPIESVIGELK